MKHRDRIQKGLRKAREYSARACPPKSVPSRSDVKENKIKKPLIEAFWPVKHRPRKEVKPLIVFP